MLAPSRPCIRPRATSAPDAGYVHIGRPGYVRNWHTAGWPVRAVLLPDRVAAYGKGQPGSASPVAVAVVLLLLASRASRADDGSVAIEWRERIGRVQGVRSGQPIIRGLRITVKDVLGFLASGMTVAEILHDFPELEEADIQAALAYAAENLSDSSDA